MGGPGLSEVSSARRGGRWAIVRRQPIYERDRMDPVDPAASVTLDPRTKKCAGAAVVLTGVASAPKVVEEAAALAGGTVTPQGIDRIAGAAIKLAYPVKNVVGSEPGYRRAMVKVNVVRGLTEAWRSATAGSEDGP